MHLVAIEWFDGIAFKELVLVAMFDILLVILDEFPMIRFGVANPSWSQRGACLFVRWYMQPSGAHM